MIKRDQHPKTSNSEKAKETKKLDETTEDQKPGFPKVDFKKNLGCG